MALAPHEMAIDPVRKALYVVNTLEATISVIDLAIERPTRLTELARLGLQELFTP